MIGRVGYALFILLIAFFFIAPCFLASSYQFCPKNPQNGFICYCAYKAKAPGAANLSYSTRVGKEISLEKLVDIPLGLEDLLTTEVHADSQALTVWREVPYKTVASKPPDRPPAAFIL